MKAPKEIYVSQEYAKFSTLDVLTPYGLDIFPLKYLSEESVKKDLSKKDKEIERLKNYISELEYNIGVNQESKHIKP